MDPTGLAVEAPPRPQETKTPRIKLPRNPPVPKAPKPAKLVPRLGTGILKALRMLSKAGTPVCLFLVTTKPAGPTLKDLKDDCEARWEKCEEAVARIKNITGRQRRALQDECYWCQMQCNANAKGGSELPWPEGDRCEFQGWPDGHPAWPFPAH